MEWLQNLPWKEIGTIAYNLYLFALWKTQGKKIKEEGKQVSTMVLDSVQEAGQEIAESERKMIERIGELERQMQQLTKQINNLKNAKSKTSHGPGTRT